VLAAISVLPLGLGIRATAEQSDPSEALDADCLPSEASDQRFDRVVADVPDLAGAIVGLANVPAGYFRFPHVRSSLPVLVSVEAEAARPARFFVPEATALSSEPVIFTANTTTSARSNSPITARPSLV